LLLLPQDLQDFAESVAAVSVFSSNILFLLESVYFDAAAEQKPLLHTWSLAVEEQFYLVFPLQLLIVWKYGHRHQARIFLAIAILSLVFAQRSVNAEHAGAFYLLPARGWELLIGCLIAFRFPPGSRPNWPTIATESLSVVGIGMLLYAIFFFDKNTPFPSAFALVPT
jgi:peptidoglycan/LPS O-acetylase OafA/YrhL